MKKLAFTLIALLLALSPVPAVPQGASVYSFWAIQHQPAAATQATIGRAAAAGTRHVATTITVCVSAVAAQPTLIFNLRDGATGAGTILWSVRLMAVIGDGMCVVAPINIAGTVNTAMTIESAAAPAATNFATVSLNGYDTY